MSRLDKLAEQTKDRSTTLEARIAELEQRLTIAEAAMHRVHAKLIEKNWGVTAKYLRDLSPKGMNYDLKLVGKDKD